MLIKKTVAGYIIKHNGVSCMFGYVRAYKPDMTFSQYDIYKGIYCSLCKQIGKRYGLISRMTLSYDMTFFALVRLCVKDECVKFTKSVCSFNPLKKCLDCCNNNSELEYCADVSMLLVYYKFLDNIDDSKGIRRFLLKLLKPYFNRIHKKAIKKCRSADDILAEMRKTQQKAEQKKIGIDECAHPSAKALAELISSGTDYQKEILYRFGYMTGRWVYIADAADDYDEDKKSNGFNPLLTYEKSDAMKIAEEALNLTLSELTESFNLLKMNCLKPIVSNIINEGMYHNIKIITGKREMK